uniref:Microtubule-associated protein 7a n=1 Tax=Cynoglossus semilaevis TaxID=244447 RepID=A0A3P8UU18_CYNSE
MPPLKQVTDSKTTFRSRLPISLCATIVHCGTVFCAADSLLFNKIDERQRLARERREEREKQNAIKEAQWQAREERARQHYEKLLEERKRKLEEQRIKEEKRRAAVEEKRRQKQEDDRIRHEAVIRRTLERSQRSRQKPNRWSWGGTLQPNTTITPADGDRRSVSTMNLSKHADPVITKRLSSSSATLLHSPDRGLRRLPLTPWESNVVNRLQQPTHSYLARSRSAMSLLSLCLGDGCVLLTVINTNGGFVFFYFLKRHSFPVFPKPAGFLFDSFTSISSFLTSRSHFSKLYQCLQKKSSHRSKPLLSKIRNPISFITIAIPVCPRSVSCHPMGSMSFKALQAQPLPHCRSQDRSLSRETPRPQPLGQNRASNEQKTPSSTVSNGWLSRTYFRTFVYCCFLTPFYLVPPESFSSPPAHRPSAGTTDPEEASRILSENRRLAREQRGREEKEQEMARRKAEERAKREEAAQRLAEERRQREEEERKVEEERLQRDREEAEKLQKEKEEEKSRQREEAERLRQEREKILQQDEAERLARKKLVEDIMKRTRRSNTAEKVKEEECCQLLATLIFFLFVCFFFFYRENGEFEEVIVLPSHSRLSPPEGEEEQHRQQENEERAPVIAFKENGLLKPLSGLEDISALQGPG